MNKDHNIGKAFEKLKSEMFLVYQGLTFERTAAGYLHNGVLCRDHHDMDILVEQEKHNLIKSINPKTV